MLWIIQASNLHTADASNALAADSHQSDAPLIKVRDATNSGGSQGHLYQQVLREALLMAARDEFNAITVDEVLREELPQEAGKHISQWEVLSNFNPASINFDVTLNRIQDDASKQVWKKRFIITKPDDDALEKETGLH